MMVMKENLWKAINKTPKDFKRNSGGLSNFEYTRSRLVWANRKNEPVLSTQNRSKKFINLKNI